MAAKKGSKRLSGVKDRFVSAKVLREARKATGLTQAQAAELAEIERTEKNRQ